MFIFKIYLKFRKEATELINLINKSESYNRQKKFLILISKKKIRRKNSRSKIF